jgi:hypothetical protein
MKRPFSPLLPSVAVVRWFLLLSWLWFALPWLWTLFSLDGADCYRLTPAAVRADLRAIRSRLLAGDDRVMHRLFPEGRLFAHSFYGFTLVNVAAANPEDREFRQHVLAELARLIPQTEALAAAPPFDQCRGLKPRGGIIAAGHANLLRAGYAQLGDNDPAILAAFHEQSQQLFEAFRASPLANLESYPSQTWPVDNLAALESLRLHDGLYRTTYGDAGDRWAQWMAAHLDPATGLFNMQIDQHGGIVDGPRGCGLSWTLAFLPPLAPDLARRQYEIYRTSFFRHPLGTTGIREFPTDRSGTFVDSDTGPIIFGLGTAATGFGIAAAKANNDVDNLTGLWRALEICSFPTYSTDLSHARFFGQVLLADEIALWGRTLTRWDAPNQWRAAPVHPQSLRHFWVVLLLLSLTTLVVTWLVFRSARRAWRRYRQFGRPLPMVHKVFLVLTILTIAACLLVPPVRWIYALILLGVCEIIETRFFPLPAPIKSP